MQSINEDMLRKQSNKTEYKPLIMLTKPNHRKMMIIIIDISLITMIIIIWL